MPNRVVELHNIMPIANMPSVMTYGILSHEQAADLLHTDVSMADVQDKRDKVQVPGGLRLHQYANLYFDARNPMMYLRLPQVESLCVLSVSNAVLNIEGVVISDQNAASGYVRFYPPSCLTILDFDQIYSDDWRHPDDRIAYWRHKAAKCAEVLVPQAIHSGYVQKAYVVSEAARANLLATGFSMPIEFMPRLFFR